MKENGWKTWAIAALTALVIGGGASGFYSDSQLHALEEKLESKIKTGKATKEETAQFAETTLATSYVRIWGEDAGKLMTDVPTITNLVDTLKQGQVIKVTDTLVTAGDRKFKFSTAANVSKGGKAQKAKQWDILNANALPNDFTKKARMVLSIIYVAFEFC